MIEGEYENSGVFVNFYCESNGIGEAFDKIIPLARKEGVSNIKMIETTRIDSLEDFVYPESLVRLSDEVQMYHAFNLFEKKDDEYCFSPPTGVIFDTREGEYEIEQIKEEFVAYAKDENGIFEFELVVDQSNLEHVFFLATKFLNSLDGFWIWITDHWEDSQRELYYNKNFVELEDVINFLEANQINTIENGFIDIVLHSKKGETNLTLNEHKKISLHTESEKVFNDFITKITGLGYKQTEDYYNIEFGYHHWHYRPGKSLDRMSFCDFLIENNFERIGNDR